MSIFEIIAEHPVVIVFIMLCTFLGVIITILTMVFSADKKKIIYHIKRNILINDFDSTVKGIDITHNGNAIESLCVSKIYIWNGGRKAVDKADLHIDTPVAFTMDESCSILDATLVSETDNTCKFSSPIVEENKVTTTFQCLERGHGGVFQIMHTNNESKVKGVDIQIKNGGRVIRHGRHLKKIILLISVISLIAMISSYAMMMLSQRRPVYLSSYAITAIANHTTEHMSEAVTRSDIMRLMDNYRSSDFWDIVFLVIAITYVLAVIIAPYIASKNKAYTSLQKLENKA
ncbi:MAG: hypothetical protein FWC73_11080 [Defluviitaleaceae bacterium]|nr:hypothetical protein [Defluviitaleaceae bacterium]